MKLMRKEECFVKIKKKNRVVYEKRNGGGEHMEEKYTGAKRLQGMERWKRLYKTVDKKNIKKKDVI